MLKVQKLEGDEWEDIEFESVRCGDVVKFFNEDGDISQPYKALGPALPCSPEGNWVVDVDLIEEKGGE
jgi:hypothetical protein